VYWLDFPFPLVYFCLSPLTSPNVLLGGFGLGLLGQGLIVCCGRRPCIC